MQVIFFPHKEKDKKQQENESHVVNFSRVLKTVVGLISEVVKSPSIFKKVTIYFKVTEVDINVVGLASAFSN